MLTLDYSHHEIQSRQHLACHQQIDQDNSEESIFDDDMPSPDALT